MAFWTNWFSSNASEHKQLLDIMQKYRDERRDMQEVYDRPTRMKSVPIRAGEIYKSLKQTIMKALGLAARGSFEPPEWNFAEITKLIQSESMFRRAIEKYVEQIWKNGWEFTGKDPRTVAYIKKRIRQIVLVTGKPTMILFQEIAFGLVAFNNSIIVKKRNDKASGGRAYTTFDGKKRQPIAGLFVPDPATMYVDRDENGNVRQWKQVIDKWGWGTTIKSKRLPTWKPYNIIHMQDRAATSPQYFFAMPMVIPVIADIKALREVEELSIIQGIKFANPRYHARVGDDKRPGIQEEINQVAADIDNLPDDGVLVTSSRTKIENISSGDEVMQLEKLLDYWKARVRSGLGMSGVGMGEGDTSNRSTAETMTNEMQNTSIKFQKVIKAYFEEFIIADLLYETGFTPGTLNEDNMVYLHIDEVDLENKIKKENHTIELFNNNGITHEELRKDLGRDKMSDTDMKQTKAELFPEKDLAAENSASNKDRPANQYGKQNAKPKSAKDDMSNEQTE